MPAADLIFRIGANSSGFRKGMDDARRDAKRTGADLSTAFTGAGRALAGMAAAFGIGFGFKELRQTVAEVAKIGDAASRVGLTVEQFQEMGYAARQTGVDVGVMTDGLRQFTNMVSQAAGGASNDFTRTLAANGVALRDSSGAMRSNMDLLRDYADLIRNAKSEQDAIRLAVMAFGEQAGQMVGTLRNGSAGLDEMTSRARDLGIVLSGDTVRAAQELDAKFNEIVDRMGSAWKDFVVRVAGGVDAIVQMMGKIDDVSRGDVVDARLNRLGAERIDLEARLMFLESRRATMNSAVRARQGVAVKNEIEQIRERMAAITQEEKALLARGKAIDNRNNPPAFGADGAGSTILPGGGSSAARGASTKAEIDRAAQLIDALKREYDALGQTNEQKRIANELARAGVDASTAEGQAIADLVRMIEAKSNAMEAARIRIDEWKARQDAARQSSEYLGQTMESTLMSIVDGSAKASDALKRVAVDLAIAAAKALLFGQGPLAGLMGPATLPGGSISPMVARAISAGQGGLFARGGISNRPAIFGEAGPEAAVPLPDGRRIPVDLRGDAVGRAAPAQVAVQVINNNNSQVSTSGSGSQADPLRIVVEAVKSDMANGGFDKAMGGRFGNRPVARAR